MKRDRRRWTMNCTDMLRFVITFKYNYKNCSCLLRVVELNIFSFHCIKSAFLLFTRECERTCYEANECRELQKPKKFERNNINTPPQM